MSSIDRITKLSGQYEKEMELAEKHRNRAKEYMELAEKHTKKAGDLEKQIKYEKGGEVFDRVDALNLTPEELQLLLQLLDDRTQLMDAVRKMFPERLQNDINDMEAGKDTEEHGEDEDIEADIEDEEIPVFGEDESDEKGEEIWSA